MSTLDVTQTLFAEALRNRSAVDAVLPLLEDVPDLRERMAVIRGCVRANHLGAMSAMFPVVGMLVGAHGFEILVAQYRQRFPSRHGDLGRCGASFSAFLATHSSSVDLPYLHEVAAIESALHDARKAADNLRPDWGAVGSLPAQALMESHPQFNAAVRVVASSYSAGTILRCHATVPPASMLHIKLSEEDVLVSRVGWRPVVTVVPAAMGAFLRLLVAGATVRKAVMAALGIDQEFELAGALRMLCEVEAIAAFVPAATAVRGDETK